MIRNPTHEVTDLVNRHGINQLDASRIVYAGLPPLTDTKTAWSAWVQVYVAAAFADLRKRICLTCEPPAEPTPEPGVVPARIRFAMCGKKHRYRNQAKALGAALRSAKRTTQMRVYRCPLCRGWHLTHKEAKAS